MVIVPLHLVQPFGRHHDCRFASPNKPPTSPYLACSPTPPASQTRSIQASNLCNSKTVLTDTSLLEVHLQHVGEGVVEIEV